MGEPYTWWGLRIREPYGIRLQPLQRVEAALVGLCAAVVLESLWLAWIVVAAVPLVAWRSTVLAPVLLLVLPLALCIAVPLRTFDSLLVSPFVLLSRERGSLRVVDRWGVLLCAVSAGCFLLEAFRPASVTAVALAIASGGAAFVLGFVQEPVVGHGGRRRSAIPPEVRVRLGLDANGLEGPEPGARSLLRFETAAGKAHSVGVAIPDDLFNRIRRLNCEHKGRLWQSSLAVVVLAEGPPADAEAGRLVRELCRQLAVAAERDGLSRWELANQVLALVQREIVYKFDKDSTAGFPGGPFDEYGRFPLETVADRVGDCECTSILCAALLLGLGYSAAVILVEITRQGGLTARHAMVGVDPGDALPPEIREVLDHVAGEDGRQFVCGETAIDGGTLAFGVDALGKRADVQVREVLPVLLPN